MRSDKKSPCKNTTRRVKAQAHTTSRSSSLTRERTSGSCVVELISKNMPLGGSTNVTNFKLKMNVLALQNFLRIYHLNLLQNNDSIQFVKMLMHYFPLRSMQVEPITFDGKLHFARKTAHVSFLMIVVKQTQFAPKY